ncbi:flagellar protein export ATPase FliI [Solimonas sp. K1W22B-7]|uniref:flagellar protein export ATPase FliI n=1 Tax=Solimonas sp. K1W22B-7 TaxID=2303331 RepID=UPI000E33624A|nr:flagellar protein export ATPase FliI [Solimonas sp. K1W22B-7]AXQ28231.1 flagellar protein export ATPase FliI [Solimonas sp. K1W22B-7]
MSEWAAARNRTLTRRLRAETARIPAARTLMVEGTLKRVVGLTLEAVGCQVQIGARCRVANADGTGLEAEVVGFSGDRTFLMPIGDMQGLKPNARVIPIRHAAEVAVGEGLLGRVLDGEGRPLDGKGRLDCNAYARLQGTQINPLSRSPISEPLDVGVRTINSLLSVGRGQRLGLFAGTGVGKSTLLGMMTRFTKADVIVVGLVGERGREVRDFLDHNLGPEGLRRAVVVATPADRSPLMRLRGAYLATAIAEYFRDQGRHVLLLMDSLTRFAQAQREIGLAVGEPPTTRGYPPSVFAKLPALVERAGNGIDGAGSITAFYTVLTEGDDPNDPIADTARGILDGHIVLSRAIADAGLYPAIDIEASISRVANEITVPEHQQRMRQFKALFSAYQRNRDLINIGAYQKGSDARVDAAIARWPRIEEFLRQDVREPAGFDASRRALDALLTT